LILSFGGFVGCLYLGLFFGKLGFFGGFFGGLRLGFFSCSFFGVRLGFLSLKVTDVIYGLTVKVNTCQASRLTGEFTHVAKVIAANFTALSHLNLEYKRAVEQKALFYANAAGNSPYGDAAGVATAPVAAYNKTLKNLDALFGAFSNSLVDFHRVAGLKVRKCPELGIVYVFDYWHIKGS
jgi:hypothetical protein